jgi:phage tail sheath gpL-like
MPVDFNRIPPNLRVPLFWAEFDATAAGYLATASPACLIGAKLAAAPAPTETPVLVSGPDQAAALFGGGSMLYDMVATYRLNDPTGELWCVAAAAPAGGAAATATVTFAGTPTASSTVAIYVGAARYALPVSSTSTATTLGQALADAVTADPFAAVTATPAAGVVTLTTKTEGEIADTLALGVNLRGIRGGEYTPAGLTVTATAFTGGAGVPDVVASLAALADAEYDYIGVGWSDAATLDAIEDAMNDAAGRWAWSVQLYGHAFTAQAGDLQDLVDYGTTRNDPHTTLMGYPSGSPSPAWRVAAALTAEAAVGLRADPARPLQTLPLIGIVIAPRGSRFTVGDRQSCLFHGVATLNASVDDSVHIERSITTYQRNAYGQGDPSWLDVQTPATLQYIVRTLRNAILTKFPRHKLANDGTRFGAGQAIVTPKIIKAELIAQYSALEEQGIVENMDAFKQFLIVERDAVDPNRVNVLLPPDLVNQLRIFAMLVQFRLQYSPQATTSVAA